MNPKLILNNFPTHCNVPGAGPSVRLCVCRDEPPSVGGDVVAPEVVEVLVAVPATEQVERLGYAVQQHLGGGGGRNVNRLLRDFKNLEDH